MIPVDVQIDKATFIHREDLKRFYSTEMGIEVLAKKIVYCGVLGVLPEDDELQMKNAVLRHNHCIEELQEIGILDEEGLRPLLKYLLGQVTKRPVEGEEE